MNVTDDTKTNPRWQMAGTEGTNEYRVPADGQYGKIGVRTVNDYEVRVRIEPVDSDAAAILADFFSASAGWKQYGEGGEYRFSKVYDAKDSQLAKTIRRAIKALGPVYTRGYNPRQLKLAFFGRV